MTERRLHLVDVGRAVEHVVGARVAQGMGGPAVTGPLFHVGAGHDRRHDPADRRGRHPGVGVAVGADERAGDRRVIGQVGVERTAGFVGDRQASGDVPAAAFASAT